MPGTVVDPHLFRFARCQFSFSCETRQFASETARATSFLRHALQL